MQIQWKIFIKLKKKLEYCNFFGKKLEEMNLEIAMALNLQKAQEMEMDISVKKYL